MLCLLRQCRRKRTPNVAYGYGTHVCIGEYLSLVELECAFRGLFTRLPNLQVGVQGHWQEVGRGGHVVVRGGGYTAAVPDWQVSWPARCW
jgi:cytochrome P450